METKTELEFYKELAATLGGKGYQFFLITANYGEDIWLYVITPNNRWLHIDQTNRGDYNIYLNYNESFQFGGAIRCNEDGLFFINEETLIAAESFGTSFCLYTNMEVPDEDGEGTHMESVAQKPEQYEDGLAAMNDFFFKKIMKDGVSIEKI